MIKPLSFRYLKRCVLTFRNGNPGSVFGFLCLGFLLQLNFFSLTSLLAFGASSRRTFAGVICTTHGFYRSAMVGNAIATYKEAILVWNEGKSQGSHEKTARINKRSENNKSMHAYVGNKSKRGDKFGLLLCMLSLPLHAATKLGLTLIKVIIHNDKVTLIQNASTAKSSTSAPSQLTIVNPRNCWITPRADRSMSMSQLADDVAPSTSDLTGTCWRDDLWLQTRGLLSQATAIDYFAGSPFWDSTSLNEAARKRGLRLEQLPYVRMNFLTGKDIFL
jgi:hypothetical protein